MTPTRGGKAVVEAALPQAGVVVPSLVIKYGPCLSQLFHYPMAIMRLHHKRRVGQVNSLRLMRDLFYRRRCIYYVVELLHWKRNLENPTKKMLIVSNFVANLKRN
ncbi:uncharacterized protein LOC110108188 [Dendrobium catenatum]|uniref:uncharacterized protein LOC110108188 n=1 Tax=Dendrobium catenatum TaxID=906689 RepID=UPI0009F1D70D|nr:uncharacterized protein LOC110108188 [Dendrobium catenatum]XP_028556513.1 uncharacterized protein LOC110108188 [Dendrobium catenatum]